MLSISLAASRIEGVTPIQTCSTLPCGGLVVAAFSGNHADRISPLVPLIEPVLDSTSLEMQGNKMNLWELDGRWGYLR